MKTLVPLLALAVTACTPATLDRDLKDIPGLTFNAVFNGASDETVLLQYDNPAGSPCYRIPADTSLTVNGEVLTLEKRGEVYDTPSGFFGCEFPRFKGTTRPAEEPLTDYVLSDGESTLRAAFKQLHATRSIRVKVNGNEQTSLRNGSTVDVEWLPVSDVLESAQVAFRLEGTPEGEEDTYTVQGIRVDANHIRFIVDARRTGNYTLRVTARGEAGLEACEGFTRCKGDFAAEMRLPMPIE